MKAALAVLAAAVVFIGVILGGWAAGWWFTEQNVNREYQVNTHSQGYVAAQVDHLRNIAEGWHATTDTAQQGSLAAEFCAIYTSLGQLPPADLVQDAAAMRCGG